MTTSHLARRSFSCLRYLASLALLAGLVVGLGPAVAAFGKGEISRALAEGPPR